MFEALRNRIADFIGNMIEASAPRSEDSREALLRRVRLDNREEAQRFLLLLRRVLVRSDDELLDHLVGIERQEVEDIRRLYRIGAFRESGVDDDDTRRLVRMGLGPRELAQIRRLGITVAELDGRTTEHDCQLLASYGHTFDPGTSLDCLLSDCDESVLLAVIEHRRRGDSDGGRTTHTSSPVAPADGATDEVAAGTVAKFDAWVEAWAETLELEDSRRTLTPPIDDEAKLDQLPDDILHAIAHWHRWLNVDAKRAEKLRAIIVRQVDRLPLSHGAALSFHGMCPPDVVRTGFAPPADAKQEQPRPSGRARRAK